MAKFSKLEDYWRDQHIESLLKEVTQLLTRRMPPDPAVAIVEHLQKKFPKSFKRPGDNIGVMPKNLANSLQLNTLTSPHPDLHNDSVGDGRSGRRFSNQSLGSGIVTIPTMGSAFTDLLKHDTSTLSEAPSVTMRNLVSASRITQQAVRLGKNIRSDHDILEEEVFRPIKHKATAAESEHLPFDPTVEDIQETPTHEEPTVRQIIKYKQHIHTENDRRLHREKLAKLARQQEEKEEFLHADPSAPPKDIQQEHIDEDETVAQVVPTEAKERKLSHKPIAKSKEEEEILNDENIFQPRKHRTRGRPRHQAVTARSAASDLHGRHARDLRSTMRNDGSNIVCKACGHVLNVDDTLAVVDYRQTSAAPIARPLESQQDNQSVETSSAAVDDWFEDASSTATSRQTTPRTFDDATPLPIDLSTFRRNLFQPIKDNHGNTVQSPLVTDEDHRTSRLTSPRISESGFFTRSPDTRVRRPSSSRSVTSPVTKKHQPDNTLTTVTSPQAIRTITQSSPPRPRRPSSSTAALPSASDRRMSSSGVREPSPSNTNGN